MLEHMHDGNRGTGRTQIMLYRVRWAIAEGTERVFVYAGNVHSIRDLQQSFKAIGGDVNKVTWLHSGSHMEGLKGIIFRDHYAIETDLARMTETARRQNQKIRDLKIENDRLRQELEDNGLTSREFNGFSSRGWILCDGVSSRD